MASLMVQGVSSDAGKSLLVCGICRSLARRGARVAPFKAQNMSNNARVVAGGEIGTAQWLQALAAGAEPDVRMNPVLLKPESDTCSQVVVLGRPRPDLRSNPWRGRSTLLWPSVRSAVASLRADYDLIVAEGAGSPAETNLWDDDIVNMAIAEELAAPVLLVADIDRGGAFAHLYGTWALLPDHWRRRIAGFVLNKFRGDPALLQPAPQQLQARTGVPTLGVMPWLDHGLPDEEGPTVRRSTGHGRRIAVLCGPYASNLDEFAGLQQVASVQLVAHRCALDHFDLVILPGSKHVAADLAWLRETGLATEITAAASQGVPILGVCGGLQALGEAIDDPDHVEGSAAGLGLLGIQTRLREEKRTAQRCTRFTNLPAPWDWLSNEHVEGYEIRHGSSSARNGSAAVALPDGLGFHAGNLLGIYLHGLFENPTVVERFTGASPPALDATFDLLADAVDACLDPRVLERLAL